jgi:hypothetical protein
MRNIYGHGGTVVSEWNGSTVITDGILLGSSIPIHLERGTNRVEIKRRCRAMHIAWECHKSFWTTDVVLRVRALCFQSLVYEAAISGLTAYVFSKTEAARIDTRILSYCRKMIGRVAYGQHTDCDGNTKYASLSNHVIWKKVRLVPVGIELKKNAV